MVVSLSLCHISTIWLESLRVRGMHLLILCMVEFNNSQYFSISCLDLHIPSFSFQSYFMGCSFDSFANTWLDKSYILTLMVLCWLAPTTMNLVCYVAILSRVRASDFEIYRVTRRLNSCHSRFHYRNKVKHIHTYF